MFLNITAFNVMNFDQKIDIKYEVDLIIHRKHTSLYIYLCFICLYYKINSVIKVHR